MKPWREKYKEAVQYAMAAEDWKKERRLARKLKALDKPPYDLDPTARLLAQQAQAGGGISWGPPPSKSDARRREADRALEKAGTAAAPRVTNCASSS